MCFLSGKVGNQLCHLQFCLMGFSFSFRAIPAAIAVSFQLPLTHHGYIQYLLLHQATCHGEHLMNPEVWVKVELVEKEKEEPWEPEPLLIHSELWVYQWSNQLADAMLGDVLGFMAHCALSNVAVMSHTWLLLTGMWLVWRELWWRYEIHITLGKLRTKNVK